MGWFEKLYQKGCSASGAAKEEQAKKLRQNVRARRPVVLTPSTRLVSRNDGSGWFLFRFRGQS